MIEKSVFRHGQNRREVDLALPLCEVERNQKIVPDVGVLVGIAVQSHSPDAELARCEEPNKPPDVIFISVGD